VGYSVEVQVAETVAPPRHFPITIADLLTGATYTRA
jgi:hypothetical protein